MIYLFFNIFYLSISIYLLSIYLSTLIYLSIYLSICCLSNHLFLDPHLSSSVFISSPFSFMSKWLSTLIKSFILNTPPIFPLYSLYSFSHPYFHVIVIFLYRETPPSPQLFVFLSLVSNNKQTLFLCARQGYNCFTYVHSFNPHDTTMR